MEICIMKSARGVRSRCDFANTSTIAITRVIVKWILLIRQTTQTPSTAIAIKYVNIIQNRYFQLSEFSKRIVTKMIFTI